MTESKIKFTEEHNEIYEYIQENGFWTCAPWQRLWDCLIDLHKAGILNKKSLHNSTNPEGAYDKSKATEGVVCEFTIADTPETMLRKYLLIQLQETADIVFRENGFEKAPTVLLSPCVLKIDDDDK